MRKEVYFRPRRRGSTRLRRSCAAAAAAVIIIIIAAVFERSMREPLRQLALEKAAAIVNTALTDATLAVLEREEHFGAELLSISERADGSYIIMADTARIAQLSSLIMREAQQRIAELGSEGVGIPIGTISGISFFTGRGPEIRIGFAPQGSVAGAYLSSLTECGINQSLFSIKIRLNVSVRLVLAGSEDVINAESTSPICETVVVGNVPQVYTNVASEEDMLNLIPNEVP